MAYHQKSLVEKVYDGPWSKAYIHAGRIIGHLGCSGFAFYDEAKKLACYDKYHFENAVRDLCVYSKREQGQYELTQAAKKVLRVIIGPSPDAPDYKSWWESRLVSVRKMKEEGQPVEWAEEPPVPLGPEEPAPGKPKARKPRARKAAKK